MCPTWCLAIEETLVRQSEQILYQYQVTDILISLRICKESGLGSVVLGVDKVVGSYSFNNLLGILLRRYLPCILFASDHPFDSVFILRLVRIISLSYYYFSTMYGSSSSELTACGGRNRFVIKCFCRSRPSSNIRNT